MTFLNKQRFVVLGVAVFFASFAAWTFINVKPSRYAQIKNFKGNEYIVDLSISRVFHVFGINNVTFEVRDNEIAFVDSDCPDKTCIRQGFIGNSGEYAACLPNRLILTIMSGGNNDFDGISH